VSDGLSFFPNLAPQPTATLHSSSQSCQFCPPPPAIHHPPTGGDAENGGVLARKEVAKLLEKAKDELARIKVEQIIRDDYYMETMELMEMCVSPFSPRGHLPMSPLPIDTMSHRLIPPHEYSRWLYLLTGQTAGSPRHLQIPCAQIRKTTTTNHNFIASATTTITTMTTAPSQKPQTTSTATSTTITTIVIDNNNHNGGGGRYLNLMIARFGLIETVKHCDPGIQEAITTVIWATPRMQGDVAELKVIKTLLQSRYGRDFVEEALENRGNTGVCVCVCVCLL